MTEDRYKKPGRWSVFSVFCHLITPLEALRCRYESVRNYRNENNTEMMSAQPCFDNLMIFPYNVCNQPGHPYKSA